MCQTRGRVKALISEVKDLTEVIPYTLLQFMVVTKKYAKPLGDRKCFHLLIVNAL